MKAENYGPVYVPNIGIILVPVRDDEEVFPM